jgi:serine/threonine protein kinase
MNICGNTNNAAEMMRHSSDPIEECDHKYERMDKLGEGTYGIVYRSKDRETNEVYTKIPILMTH